MKEAGIYYYFSLGTSWKEMESGEFQLYICKNLILYKCLHAHGHYAHKQMRMFRQSQTWAMVYAKMDLDYFNEW